MYLVCSNDSVVSDHECSLDQRIDGVVVLILLCKIHHKEACGSSAENQLQRMQSKDVCCRVTFTPTSQAGLSQILPAPSCTHHTDLLNWPVLPESMAFKVVFSLVTPHYLGICFTCNLLSPTPDLVNQQLVDWGQWTCVLPSAPGDSEVPQCLKIIAIEH